MQFKLTIELGNDAMQTGGDIADALRGLAERIDTRRGGDLADSGTVRDYNGNTVGTYDVAEEA